RAVFCVVAGPDPAVGLRLGHEQPRRADRDDPPGERALRGDGRSAHRGRPVRGGALSRARRADDLPGDRAAGEVRRDDSRSAWPRPGTTGGVGEPGSAAAAPRTYLTP